MQRLIFITGTDTGAGKTVLTVLLAQFLREHGVNVAALKPVCSGGRDDAREIFAALDGALGLEEINPWHFRAPIAPMLAAKREQKTMKLSEVIAHIRDRQKKSAVTLVEGAGGLLSPLGEGFDSRAVILALRATPIIVAQNKLGVVNHILLTLAALPKGLRAQTKIVLMSPPKKSAASVSYPQLLGEFVSAKNIFEIPWLGVRFVPATALRNARVKKTLRRLLA